MSSHRSRRPLVGRAAVLCSLAVVALSVATSYRHGPDAAADAMVLGVSEAFAAPVSLLRAAAVEPTDGTGPVLALIDSLRGRSGKLRVRTMPRSSARAYVFSHLFGDSAMRTTPGVRDVRDSAGAPLFSLITTLDFADKRDGRIGAYRIGFWPAESGRAMGGLYGNPAGFIEVTRENVDTPVSEHFRLRDFLTKDQQDVWPKYLVLREELVDKLELVIGQLEMRGVEVRHMSVMSGFRTPQYNAQGGETSGRADVSRHMYGDAADVFVDNDRDGRMDDLNRDGRVNHRDAQVILDAVDRVERAYPEVVGGVGVYRANSAHGPFAHVDVRGYRARWGLL
jgi:uncharacterized protein YcbK (DUF882 family)